jgi:hypothetical protein
MFHENMVICAQWSYMVLEFARGLFTSTSHIFFRRGSAARSFLKFPRVRLDPGRRIDRKCRVRKNYPLDARKTVMLMEEGDWADWYLCRSVDTFLHQLRKNLHQKQEMMYVNRSPLLPCSLRKNPSFFPPSVYDFILSIGHAHCSIPWPLSCRRRF